MSYEFMSKFRPEVNCIKEFDYWLICIRPDQITLGDAIFILKREIASLGDMKAEESAELSKVFCWYESKMNKLFSPDKYNYTVAMMRDNFVHFHAFPRYSCEKTMFGYKWEDLDWPRVIEFKKVAIPEDIFDNLRIAMKEV